MMYIQAEYNQICYENVNACAVIGSKPCTPTLYIETKPTPSPTPLPTPSHYTRSYPASEKQKGKLSQTRNHAIILINNLYENVRDNLWFLEIQHIFCTVITDLCTVIRLFHCDNRFMHCDNRLLHCDNRFMHCDNRLFHCDNRFVHCDNRLFHCDNIFVHCDNIFVHCDNSFALLFGINCIGISQSQPRNILPYIIMNSTRYDV